MSKELMQLTRRAFLSGLVLATATACTRNSSDDPTSKDLWDKIDDSLSKAKRQGPMVTDEELVAENFKRDALLSGRRYEYVDLYDSIERKDRHEDSEYLWPIRCVQDTDLWRMTDKQERLVTYSSSGIATDVSYSSRKITLAENGLCESIDYAEYRDAAFEDLGSRRIRMFDTSGNEISSSSTYYERDGSVSRDIYTEIEYDENGYRSEESTIDISGDVKDTKYLTYEREINDEGLTLYHETFNGGVSECVCEYVYDEQGQITEKSYANDGYDERLTFLYDDKGRLIEALHLVEGEATSHLTYEYLDEYHRINVYDEIEKSYHDYPSSYYLFDSKGQLAFAQIKYAEISVVTHNSYGDVVSCETYYGDQLQSIERGSYDIASGLLKACSRVALQQDGNEVVETTVYAYVNQDTDEVSSFEDLKDVYDLCFDNANTAGPHPAELARIGYSRTDFDVDLESVEGHELLELTPRETLALADEMPVIDDADDMSGLVFHNVDSDE